VSAAFDLDAVGADIEPFRFVFGGTEFTMPCLDGLPYDQAERFGQSEERDALAQLLGDQWEAFRALSPTLAQVKALAEQWWKYQGTSPPESLASRRS
jgi:hypothetical protein